MIGNDIVDLSFARSESNWRRKGFLKKVFSREEQAIILSAQDKDLTVWLLWSFKEAAYKAHQRVFKHPPILNWLRQQCQLISCTNNSATGVVTIEDREYYTTSEFTSEYIHTVARKSMFKPVKNVLFEGSSEETKTQLIKQIANHFSVPFQKVSFQKCKFGIPYIQYLEKAFYSDFSFSDHGRFSGFSLSLRIS